MLHTHLLPDTAARRRPFVRDVVPPKSYDLNGDGIWVAYFPDGLGSCPVADGARLIYRDARGTRTFGSSEIDTAEAPGFGTVVTVVLNRALDTDETFSLILPSIEPFQVTGLPVSLRTFAVTTMHRSGVNAVGHRQREMYSLTTLTGQAFGGIVPAGATALGRERRAG